MQNGDTVIYHHPLKPSKAVILRRRGGNQLDIAAELYGHVQFVDIGTGPGQAAPAGWEAHHGIPTPNGRPAHLPPEPFPLPVQKPPFWKLAALVGSTAAVTELAHLVVSHFVR